MWKQYIVVAVLLLVSLMLIAAISIPAILPSVVTPPAAVPGGRVVLAVSAMPDVGHKPLRIGVPLVDERQAFYIQQPLKGELVAVLARWSPAEGAAECAVVPVPPFTAPVWSYSVECPPGVELQGSPIFGPRGEPIAAPRSLVRYNVSVSGDRVVVNVANPLREYGATPQPKVAPLATP